MGWLTGSGRARRRKPARVPAMISSPVDVKAKHNRLSSLTAAGEKVDRKSAESIRRVQQPWQSRAFAYYDSLGEIKYAAHFYSRMLSQIELFAAEQDETSGEWKPTKDPEALDALARIQDPGGGRSGLLSQYGILMFLTGEAELFVSKDTKSKLEQWEMLSADELRYESGGYQRYRAPSLGAEDYKSDAEADWVPVDDDHAVAYRLWQKHPRYSYLADSTMQGVLDLCEELLLLTQAVRSRARSRLAGAGILFIDASISPAPDEDVPDEDADEDPFISELTEAMTEPIADEGSAAAVVPMVVRVDVPENKSLSEMVYHLQLIDPTQLYPETGLRYEIIKRIATGLDMPPEELLGMSDANHWTAWQVDEDTWKAHGAPKAQQLCDDLTSAYFRPYLAGDAGQDAEKAMRFAIRYDASKAINHPDRGKDAVDLYDRVAIGKRALRQAKGFDENDAPTEEERAERVGILVRDASLAWYGEPSVKTGGVEVAPGEIVNADTSGGTTDGGAATGSEVEPGPPVSSEANPDVVAALVMRVIGAADLSVLRAREHAGAKLRSLARRNPELHVNGTRNGDLASTLGREAVRSLRGPSEMELVAGARPLLIDAMRAFGVEDQAIIGIVVDQVEKYAAQTLYDLRPGQLPPAFAQYVQGLLTAGR